jgi:hypothetical protein
MPLAGPSSPALTNSDSGCALSCQSSFLQVLASIGAEVARGSSWVCTGRSKIAAAQAQAGLGRQRQAGHWHLEGLLAA